jgi:AcrR family transcriptional regulator
MTGLRALNKAKRRDAILDAATELLRAQHVRTLTIERIAAAAEVSPPTIYNLIGTRDQLLLALVERVLERLVHTHLDNPAHAGIDPIATARGIIDISAAAFIADSAVYRQIVGSLVDVAQSGSQMAFDPAMLQIAAMRDAQARGILRDDLDPVVLGRQIYLAYNGALFEWAAHKCTDAEFVAAARHGLATVLAAAATDEHRPLFLREMRELGNELVAAQAIESPLRLLNPQRRKVPHRDE